jgi:hypothetical protein
MPRNKQKGQKTEIELEPESILPEKQSNKVDLLNLVEDEILTSPLEVVRLGEDQTPIIPFTSSSEAVNIHYCSYPEINSYIICNEPKCLLCQIGRKQDKRLLLPVYLPLSGCIGVLPVGRSMRPFALLPQLFPILKSQERRLLFITRQGARYTVDMDILKDDVDAGEEVIHQFLEDYSSGHYDLTSVYMRIDNEELSQIGEISKMMALKGIRLDGDN